MPLVTDRDPANALYDRACDLLQAARGLEATAEEPTSAPAIAATLGAVEHALADIAGAIEAMGATASRSVARRDGAGALEPDLGHSVRLLDEAGRDLSRARTSCAAVRRLVGPLVAEEAGG